METEYGAAPTGRGNAPTGSDMGSDMGPMHGRPAPVETDLAPSAWNPAPGDPDPAAATRDIAEVPAVELITTTALHLMSAAAVKVGLAPDEQQAGYRDLDEARKLITALAGLVTASAPELGSHHAAPLRDGLKSLQLAFREASVLPDPPGQGPGEKFTGPVYG